MVTYCHLQPPLTSEIPFNIFDLTRSSQETDSLSPNTHHLRLVLAAIPTFNCLPQGNQTILPLNSFKKVVKEDWGRGDLNKVSQFLTGSTSVLGLPGLLGDVSTEKLCLEKG